jgi:hypothetical protein
MECYTRAGEEWRLSEALGLNSTLALPALKIVVFLSEVFPRVDFGLQTLRLHS